MDTATTTTRPNAPATASATITRVAEPETRSEVYVMRLDPRPHVRFDEETAIDNEFFGRKKSKRCCIFHKKREFGESSSESEPDSDDSSSSAEERRVTWKKKQELKATGSHLPTKKKHMCNDPECTEATS
ncbi:hypothetical protein H310_03078 [Aphanomyces invadans]|uniref:Protein phosphatase inhibitor n=1 Tax=Aphanomyces invadans TaxID=157072 RepID=A0A024UKM1_9STRA|nr:hypothetical protein H310_03078 [Aphanomyces invadans]ETW06976.1 hypothetical protein H310_03078 [Aphanomyces invadans]|eukprot:XP_008865051.1 hypothetical protein H310_03078 [Aphanomyces invadans]